MNNAPEKLQNWRSNCQSLLTEYIKQPYVFGKKDCFQLLIEMEMNIRGRSLWVEEFGTYDSEEYASKVLRSKVLERNPRQYVDRLYDKGDRFNPKIGDMTFISGSLGLPHVFFFDPLKDCFVTFLSKDSLHSKTLEKELVSRLWEL